MKSAIILSKRGIVLRPLARCLFFYFFWFCFDQDFFETVFKMGEFGQKRDSYTDRYSGTSDRSKRMRSRSPPQNDNGRGGIDTYIPEYSRDGYQPGPRNDGGQVFINPQSSSYPPPSSNLDRRLSDPEKSDYQVSFKHYAEYSRKKLGIHSDDEIQSGFTGYKARFLAKSLEKFFEAKKQDEWFLRSLTL
jgi:hypothetical protein